jgi:succinyl-CoA synthetase beta subunit
VDLLEHRGKTLFAGAGLPVLASRLALTPAEAQGAAGDLGLPVVVKAQVKTGGRGKAGGIRVCATADEVAAATADILAMTIRGHGVTCVLVEQAVEVARELYLAISSSRAQRGPVLVFSAEGGVDVEEVARRDPTGLVRTPIDPLLGLCDYQVRDVVAAAALDAELAGPDGTPAKQSLAGVVRALGRLYRDGDATLCEINPLVVTTSGEIVCLDSKVTIDDNALYRHAELKAEADAGAEDREARARQAGLAFVALDGDIGVLGNGAGLVMSTIDQIAAAGGSAADFCDIGGGARAEVVATALDVILSMGTVSSLLVSIFAGITRCDEVARGLVQVLGQSRVDVPVVVRLDGNAAAEGRAVLADARLPGLIVAAGAADAVRLAVAGAAARAGPATQAGPDARREG